MSFLINSLVLFFFSSYEVYMISGSITGYDCNSTQTLKAIYSLDTAMECNHDVPQVTSSVKMGQIVQKKKFVNLSYKQCLIMSSYMIYHCGMHSHTSLADFSSISHAVEVSRDECLKMITTKVYQPRGRSKVQIPVSITQASSMSFYVYGHSDPNGACKGESFIHKGTTYSNHVMRESIGIIVKEETGSLDLISMKVMLGINLKCGWTEGTCYDAEKGRFLWDTEGPECLRDLYDVLYEGSINITESMLSPMVLSVLQDGFILAAEVEDPTRICNIVVSRTSVEDIYLSYKTHNFYQFPRSSLNPLNVNLARFINAKVGYYAYTATKKSEEIYNDLINKICMVNMEAIKNKIQIMKNARLGLSDSSGMGAGILARVIGEVVYLFKCQEVQVDIRHSPVCHLEIPVLYNGTEAYLTPFDRFVTYETRVIPCSSIAPPMFNINGLWYTINHNIVETIPPRAFTPSQNSSVLFRFDWTTINGGIYSSKDMNSLQSVMMFGKREESRASMETSDNLGVVLPSSMMNSVTPSESFLFSFRERFMSSMSSLDWFGIKYGVVMFIITILGFCRGIILNCIKGYYLKDGCKCSNFLISFLGGSFFFIVKMMSQLKNQDSEAELNDVEKQDVPEEEIRESVYEKPKRLLFGFEKNSKN